MNITGEVLRRAQIRAGVPSKMVPKSGAANLDIETLITACLERGVPIEEHIAKYVALTASDAEEHDFNAIRLHKEQVDVLLKLLNKKIPDRKAMEHSGADGGAIPLILSQEDAGVL